VHDPEAGQQLDRVAVPVALQVGEGHVAVRRAVGYERAVGVDSREYTGEDGRQLVASDRPVGAEGAVAEPAEHGRVECRQGVDRLPVRAGAHVGERARGRGGQFDLADQIQEARQQGRGLVASQRRARAEPRTVQPFHQPEGIQARHRSRVRAPDVAERGRRDVVGRAGVLGREVGPTRFLGCRGRSRLDGGQGQHHGN
jgi:hypothetical protein